jgi:hypothetical protein
MNSRQHEMATLRSEIQTLRAQVCIVVASLLVSGNAVCLC